MDHFFYASFQGTAVFKRKSMQQGLPVEGCVGVTVQIHILSAALLVVNIYMLCTCMTVLCTYMHVQYWYM